MKQMTHKHTKELDIFCNEHHDNCTLCNRAFVDGDTAHLGYIEDCAPAFLCDNCAHRLNETVVRYYWQKREYEIPDPNDKLWRYMDISKFISLVSKKELFFSAAKCFTDPFEGAKGIIERQEKWDNFYSDFLRHALLTVPGADPNRFSEEELQRETERLLGDLHLSGKASRELTFISCWHMNDYESEAMWKLYSKDITNAIAIQTTYQRLYESLGKDPSIAIGKVHYIDFSNSFSSASHPYWYKHASFEYEKEVRAIVTNFHKKGEVGVTHSIDIDLLIENIYVSPYAPQWFYDVVQSILEKYEISKEILQSQMKATPFY